jgi:general secretion pathway protein G
MRVDDTCAPKFRSSEHRKTVRRQAAELHFTHSRYVRYVARTVQLRGQRGFTLLEVMVVVVILGILAALVVPRIVSRPDEARTVAAKQDIATLMQALQLYRLDNRSYPSTEQGLQALVARPATAPLPPNWKSGGYLERLPRDPWGNPYQYLNPGLQGEIDVFSFGADGTAGGEGNDADIGSWNL